MGGEFIAPIQLLDFSTGQDKVSKTGNTANKGIFQDIFQGAMKDVEGTQANLENQQYLLATGQVDDAHTVMIAGAEAQLSVDLLVQLRNKAVDSVNELMRTGL